MKPIPVEIITQVPDKVTPDRESCQTAADKALLLLFTLGNEAATPMTWPPIVSNGVELWPLPPPWSSDEERKLQLLENLNGDPEKNQTGLLWHVKHNGHTYNAALESGAIPDAEQIVAISPSDSASLWSDCNALAAAVCDESVFQTLQLSIETRQAYYQAKGLGS